MGAAWWTQSNISDIYLQIILLYITERTIERFCSVPHWFKCHWQTWEQADFLTPCKFGCLLQIEMCFSSCSVTGCTDPLLLLRPCTVWRSWASRWRRWILTEEPSLWVTLWAAPELDRWWRCSTSSDAEGRGSSRLPHTLMVCWRRRDSLFLSCVFLAAGRTASCPCALAPGWEPLLCLNTLDRSSRTLIRTPSRWLKPLSDKTDNLPS